MGLQITAGAKSFTVFCLGNSGQLAAFTAGTVAGATVSAGSTTTLSNVDITFDSGSKLSLEANLKTQVAPGLPTAVLQCDHLAVQVATAVNPLLARRHLLFPSHLYLVPDAEELAKIAVGLDGALDILAAASGTAREQWTAVNARVFTLPGQDKLIVTIFVKATPAEGTNLITNWATISATAGLEAFIFGTSVVSVPEGDFPSLSVSLNINLQLDATETVENLTAQGFADVDLFDDRR
jgi:hypothetical protein